MTSNNSDIIQTATQIYHGRFPAFRDDSEKYDHARSVIIDELSAALTEYRDVCEYHDDGDGYWAHGEEAGSRAIDRELAKIEQIIERYYELLDHHNGED